MLKEHILDGADVLQPVHQEGFVVQLTDLNADLGVTYQIEGAMPDLVEPNALPANRSSS
jgi:hypothetical protein